MSTQHMAAGFVVFFDDRKGGRTYLLIRHSAGHWELPKGHIEPGETWRQTALRELHEETGISDAEVLEPFARQIRYVYRDRKDRMVEKQVSFGLARARSADITLSREHTDFIFLNYAAAIRQLTHAGTRAVLRDAEEFIATHFQRTVGRSSAV